MYNLRCGKCKQFVPWYTLRGEYNAWTEEVRKVTVLCAHCGMVEPDDYQADWWKDAEGELGDD